MRSDKKKSLSKVAKVALTNPLLSQREIAEETWLSVGNVNDKLNELEQSGKKDDRILHITDTDLEIVRLGQAEINRRMKTAEELEKMRTSEISQVIRENTARYTLFRWSATDNEWGLKNIESIEIL